MSTEAAKKAFTYIADNAGRIRDVTVAYDDATVISGFVRRVERSTVNLCRHSSGNPQYFNIDFERAVRILVTSHDGVIAAFDN
jgi:hypothetical protein